MNRKSEGRFLRSRLELLYVSARVSTVSEGQTLAGVSYRCLVGVWLPRIGV